MKRKSHKSQGHVHVTLVLATLFVVGVCGNRARCYERYFYTISDSEKDQHLDDPSWPWEYQGVAYYAFADDSEPGVTPVYRFHRTSLNNYFYTSSETEKDKMVDTPYSEIWDYEGVMFYVYPNNQASPDSLPVYRFWSAASSTHFFTADEDEKNEFITQHSDIWTFEGLVWYVPEATEGVAVHRLWFSTEADTTPPEIFCPPDPIVLWPPNHKYVTLGWADLVLDVWDDHTDLTVDDVVIARVTSDEPEDVNGGGDGNTVDDIVIGPDCHSVNLRKERQGGGNGRVYTVHLSVHDEAGNQGTAVVQVQVPHDKKDTAVDDGPAYEVIGCEAPPENGSE